MAAIHALGSTCLVVGTIRVVSWWDKDISEVDYFVNWWLFAYIGVLSVIFAIWVAQSFMAAKAEQMHYVNPGGHIASPTQAETQPAPLSGSEEQPSEMTQRGVVARLVFNIGYPVLAGIFVGMVAFVVVGFAGPASALIRLIIVTGLTLEIVGVIFLSLDFFKLNTQRRTEPINILGRMGIGMLIGAFFCRGWALGTPSPRLSPRCNPRPGVKADAGAEYVIQEVINRTLDEAMRFLPLKVGCNR